MKVLIISANKEEINMRTWPLGAICVTSAARKAGHEVEFVDLMEVVNAEKVLRQAIEKFQPKVIGLSVRNVDDQSMLGTKFFLEEIKRLVLFLRSISEALIVLGGAGYSIYPIALLDYLEADMGIQGEGETAFVSLLNQLEKEEEPLSVPGLYLPKLGLQENRLYEKHLDNFSLPDINFLPHYHLRKNDKIWVPIQTRRGCAMKCSYCSTPTIEGSILRKRSPEKIVEWLRQWRELGQRHYYFVDNTFNFPLSYAKKLCALLVDVHLDLVWRCIVYPFRIDEELARLMAESGCKEVSIGFESGSELVLHGMNKRFRPEEVRKVCETFGRYGIRRTGFLLLGGPGETQDSALESLAFADSLNLECMKVTVGIRIYPETALAKTAVEHGMISSSDNLLMPRFYLSRGLETWLKETVDHWMSTRPNWFN